MLEGPCPYDSSTAHEGVPLGGTWKQGSSGGSLAIAPCFKIRQLNTRWWAASFLALLSGVYTLPAQIDPSLPRFAFSKTLKGSSPEYMTLNIDAKGAGTYDSHKLEDPPAPRPVQLSAGTTAQIFALAQSLDDFRSLNLESRHKVANMGLKTLTYEAGNETNRVQYNYTENRTAQQLTELCEKIGNVEERIGELEYDMKYDHLSVPQVLREIQVDMDEQNLAEPALMIPTLERISANSHLLHLAQARAQEIMERIQANK